MDTLCTRSLAGCALIVAARRTRRRTPLENNDPKLATSSTATMPFGVAFALPRSCCRTWGDKAAKMVHLQTVRSVSC
jgi:hypothetical protein